MKRPFRGLRHRPPNDVYDAVIIGAGIGGLICANLLAREGLSVLLTEQHYMVGGYCSTFRRKGYTFDAATHFYPLLGNPATITGKLLLDLGITNGWVKMDPVDHFHFLDGSNFAVPADFDIYLGKLKAEYPEEARALDKFFALVREVFMFGLLSYFRWRDTDRLARFRHMTVREALDQHFQNEKLKLLLAADCGHWGSPPSRTSFVFDSMLRLSYFLGNYYPRGGSQAFADELALRFEESGGHILMGSTVRRILARNKTATGVEVEMGTATARSVRRVNAGVVVSNADLLSTLERLLEPSQVDPDAIASIRKLRPTHPCFLTHIGLKNMPTEVLLDAAGYHWDSWDSEKVVVKLSASALTSQRFTVNHHGAMLGWEMSPDQLGEQRPALNGLVKNLYFTGHWTQPGGGITPVIVSAMQVAKRIIDGKEASSGDLYPNRVLSASGEAFANVA